MHKVFIDGSAGTTGLRIRERLANRPDIRLITLPEQQRKDPTARLFALAQADVAFLCLPDAAATEIAAMADTQGLKTVIIDTSTAHRTAQGWTYGFPELAGQREKVAASTRIANPGCHATGFIACAAPLVAAGLIAPDADLSAFSLTGYSGGGKSMIAQYEAPADERDPLLGAPRLYGLGQTHKHLPEMVKMCGLAKAPVFAPIVGDYYAGMLVCVPVFGLAPEVAISALTSYYGDARLVRVRPDMDESGFMSAGAMANRDSLELAVFGNGERALVCARFDNLGKGASGAAIQNMNIVLGADEALGLVE